jgi:hypothetical protein
VKPFRSGAEVLQERLPTQRRALAAAPSTPAPEYVAAKLAQLRLLHDVPFAHLVPDAKLLPPESLRFFTVDAAWTDALIEGAQAVGVTSAAELAHHEATVQTGLDASHLGVRAVRDRRRGREATLQATPPQAITGLLLRSLAVSQFPGIQVRAYSGAIPASQDPETTPGATKLALLRLELLAPSVMIALFDGTPSLVILEEPHTSVQLGAIAKSGGGFSLALRAGNGSVIEQGNTAVTIDVPLRAGAESLGVIDVAALAAKLNAQPQPQIPRPIGPAVLALELIRAPWRQRFGSPGNV